MCVGGWVWVCSLRRAAHARPTVEARLLAHALTATDARAPGWCAQAAAAGTAAGVESLEDAGVDLTARGVQLLREDVRQFVARRAREASGARMACGSAVPHVDAVLPERSAVSDGDGAPDHASVAQSRLAVRRLIEAHVERWVAGTWMHPLLDARASRPAAVKLSMRRASGYLLRGNGRDALWPCADAQGSAEDARAILVLDDGGDGACNASSDSSASWTMSDPRGASAYAQAPLLQLGSDAPVCARTSEIWVVPPGVPLTFAPHFLPRSRIVMIAHFEVPQTVYRPWRRPRVPAPSCQCPCRVSRPRGTGSVGDSVGEGATGDERPGAWRLPCLARLLLQRDALWRDALSRAHGQVRAAYWARSLLPRRCSGAQVEYVQEQDVLAFVQSLHRPEEPAEPVCVCTFLRVLALRRAGTVSWCAAGTPRVLRLSSRHVTCLVCVCVCVCVCARARVCKRLGTLAHDTAGWARTTTGRTGCTGWRCSPRSRSPRWRGQARRNGSRQTRDTGGRRVGIVAPVDSAVAGAGGGGRERCGQHARSSRSACANRAHGPTRAARRLACTRYPGLRVLPSLARARVRASDRVGPALALLLPPPG